MHQLRASFWNTSSFLFLFFVRSQDTRVVCEKKMRTLFLVLALGAFISCSIAAEGDSTARLLVAKNILNQYVVEGNDITVHYSIYNVGSGPATSVSLSDVSFPSGMFTTIRGLLSIKWNSIAPGSNVSHTVIIRPSNSGVFNFTAAQVSYKPSQEATKPQVAISTMPGEVPIMTISDYDRKYSPHLVDWGLFTLMALPTMVIPLLMWYRSFFKYENYKIKKN